MLHNKQVAGFQGRRDDVEGGQCVKTRLVQLASVKRPLSWTWSGAMGSMVERSDMTSRGIIRATALRGVSMTTKFNSGMRWKERKAISKATVHQSLQKE